MASTPSKINAAQIITGWSYVYPFAQRRQAAGHPILDAQALANAQACLTNEKFVRLWEQVLNGEKPADALQQEAPNEIAMSARAFAGNADYIAGLIRDTCASLHTADHVTPATDTNIDDAATVNKALQQKNEEQQRRELAAYAAANPSGAAPMAVTQDDRVIESITAQSPGMTQKVAEEAHIPTKEQVASGACAPVTSLPESVIEIEQPTSKVVVEPGQKADYLTTQRETLATASGQPLPGYAKAGGGVPAGDVGVGADYSSAPGTSQPAQPGTTPASTPPAPPFGMQPQPMTSPQPPITPPKP